MKSKVILKWTKWFYRALVVLIVALINVGPWFYLDGYKAYGGIKDAIGYFMEYQSLYFNSYICLGVILIGLVLMVLSFINTKKNRIFTILLIISALVMAIMAAVGIVLPIIDDYVMSKVWWMAAAYSVVLVITAVIGKICERNLNKQEVTESKNNEVIVIASIYGVVALVIVAVSIIIVGDKGWKIKDDTLYINREIGIYHYFDDDETLWGNEEFEELKVENGVRKIYYTGLCNNENFEEVDLPKSLRVIGEFTFSNCKNLYEIDIPDNVEVIEWCAFSECEELVEVELPKDLELIDGRAFWGCNKISYINLPNGLEVIGEYAFYGCDSLTNITIPKSVEEIGDNAFPMDTVLTVGYDSYAEEWAIENGYTYEIY